MDVIRILIFFWLPVVFITSRRGGRQDPATAIYEAADLRQKWEQDININQRATNTKQGQVILNSTRGPDRGLMNQTVGPVWHRQRWSIDRSLTICWLVLFFCDFLSSQHHARNVNANGSGERWNSRNWILGFLILGRTKRSETKCHRDGSVLLLLLMLLLLDLFFFPLQLFSSAFLSEGSFDVRFVWRNLYNQREILTRGM